MTTAQLLKKTLKRTGQSKRQAAMQIGVSRPTFDAWLFGLYVPDPGDHKRVRALADWAEITEGEMLKIILVGDKGINSDALKSAMGGYVSPNFHGAANSRIAA